MVIKCIRNDIDVRTIIRSQYITFLGRHAIDDAAFVFLRSSENADANHGVRVAVFIIGNVGLMILLADHQFRPIIEMAGSLIDLRGRLAYVRS